MTLQLPDALFRAEIGAALPPLGHYGVAVCFLPQDATRAASLEQLLAETVEAEGQTVVAWRDVPVDQRHAGASAAASAPRIRQLFVAAAPGLTADAFERKLYVIRRLAELAAGPDLVIPSFSARTVVYKGMLTAPQLAAYYPDLQDERTASALALVHSRYSTNTFPSWELSHPYRMIAHNGEINTLRGNVNWMSARESQLASELFGDDLARILPVVRPGGSDSGTFDNVLELLVLAGRSLPHAIMMMIPEAYQGREDISEELAGFYAYHGCLMEAWDGPAAIAFTDGRVIGATLDRNGLRPGRWLETRDGWVVLASETGVLDEPPENVAAEGQAAAGEAVPGRRRERPHRPGRGSEADGRVAAAVRRVVSGRSRAARGSAHAAEPRLPGTAAAQAPARLRLHAGRHEGDPRAARAERRGGGRLDGERPAARRPLRPAAAPLLLLQAALRAGDEPADRLDPRGGRDERAGERRLRAQPPRRDAGARAPARDREPDPARRGARTAPPGRHRRLPRPHDRHDVAGHRRARRARGRRHAHLRRGRRRARRRRQHPRPLRPRGRPRARADPAAARRRLRPPPPRSRRNAPPGRPDRRVGRAAQRAQRRRADRLRRRGGQPVPDARDARGARRARLAAAGDDAGRRAAPRDEGDRQGPAEGDLEDGDLDDPVLLRSTDLRGGRPVEGARRPPLHRHAFADRRDRARRARARDAQPALARVPRERGRAAACHRPLLVAPRGRVPRLEPRHDRAAPARGARRRLRDVRPVLARSSTTTRRGARRCAACSASAAPRTAAFRWTRSSPPRRSSSASRPARCRWARSRARRTRTSRSR